jgi:hypothetical protein
MPPIYPNVRFTKSSYTNEVCEMFGTRTEDSGPDEFSAKVQLKVPYVDRFALVYHLYMQDCTWPWNPRAFFKSASIQPFLGGAQSTPDIPDEPGGGDTSVVAQTINYAYALVNLTYSTQECFKDINGNYVVKKYIETFEPNVEFQIMSPELFHWGTTPDPAAPTYGRQLSIKEAPARQVRSAVYTVKWLQQEIVPFEFYNLLGSVNDAVYTIENFGAQPGPPVVPMTAKIESLMYMPGPVEKSIFYTPNALNPGDIGYDPAVDDAKKPPFPGYNYTCKFAYRPFGWNQYYRADHHPSAAEPPIVLQEYYERIYQKRPGASSVPFENYPVKDLTKLLPPPTPP